MARIFCFALVASSILSSSLGAEDWPRWRGPRGDGTWHAPQIPTSWPEDGLKVRWRAKIGAGYSGLAVKDGRVFTMDRPKEPEDRERIVCINAATGDEIWSFAYEADYEKLDYGKGPRTTPTVHDGRVYTLGAVGHLYCLDVASGKKLWSKSLKADHRAQQPTWGFAAMPVVYKDKLIVHAGQRPGGCYVAYDRKTGEEIWRAGKDPTGYGTPIIIRHNDADRLIGWTPEHIVGISPDRGEVLWQVPYKVTYGVTITTPIFHENTVLVCGYWEGSKAVQLGDGPKDAKLLWEDNRFLRGVMSQPLYRDGHVYLLDKSNGLTCFKLATGQVVWTDKHQMTPRGRNPQANLVWLGDTDRAIVLNAEGELILIRLTPKGYEESSRTKIIGETWAHPAFAGNDVFARDDKEVVCVQLAGGE